MKTYETIKADSGVTVVTELNAAVLTSTFKSKGIQKADLYAFPHCCKQIVKHGSCPPVGGKLIDTININL